MPWHERKQKLSSLKLSGKILPVQSVIVDDAGEARKAITFFSNLPGSEGAVIKEYEGKYYPGKESATWIKYRNVDKLILKVLAVRPKEGGKSYTVGIKPPPDAVESYITDGYLKLGNTFVTKDVDAAVGDNILVTVEEVWRHKYPKLGNKIRYSIHKPRVLKKTDSSLSTWQDLDKLAVSKGEERIELSEDKFYIKFIGTGAMNSPRKDESLFIDTGKYTVLIDAGKDIKPGDIPKKPDLMIATDEESKNFAELKRLAKHFGSTIGTEDEYELGDLKIIRHPVKHTSHPTYGFEILYKGAKISYAPEFYTTPKWIDGSDLAILEGSAWSRPITFTGGVGGHAAILDTIEDLTKLKVKKVMFTHIGKPTEEAIKNGEADGVPIAEDGMRISITELEATQTTSPGIDTIQGRKIDKKKKPIQASNATDHEGGEVMVRNFPKRMQQNFLNTKGKWMPWVMQWHLRGEKSIHTDLRLKVKPGLLEGFTLFTPGGIDLPDKLTENPHHLRGTIKVPQPEQWLTVEGGFKRGAPGTTTNKNAYFAIVAKGEYRILEVTDHKISFEMRSKKGKVSTIKPISPEDKETVDKFNKKLPDNYKQLNGCFSYHIAHIEPQRWIILFDKLKNCPKNAEG